MKSKVVKKINSHTIQIIDAKTAHEISLKNVIKQIDGILGSNIKIRNNYKHVITLIEDAISKGAVATVVGQNSYYPQVIDILRMKGYSVSEKYNPGSSRIISWHPKDKVINAYMYAYEMNDYGDFHLYEPVSQKQPVQFLGRDKGWALLGHLPKLISSE